MQLTPAVYPLARSLYWQPSSIIRQYVEKDRVQTTSIYFDCLCLIDMIEALVSESLLWS